MSYAYSESMPEEFGPGEESSEDESSSLDDGGEMDDEMSDVEGLPEVYDDDEDGEDENY